MANEMADTEFEFEAALSFAGEDRDYVREVYDRLTACGRTIFFDESRQAEIWGSDLPEFLDSIYRERCRYVVVFISQHYAAKAWPRFEKRSALARALEEKGAYILPVRLDDTTVPGLAGTIGYIDTRRTGIDDLVRLLIEKLDGLAPSWTPPKWDGKSPKTAEHIAVLIQEKPPGWEYLLLAGVLLQRMATSELEDKYRDHELRYAKRSHQYVAEGEIGAHLQRAHAQIGRLVGSLNDLLGSESVERALGPENVAGDPDRIAHLAKRLVDWSTNSLPGLRRPSPASHL